MGSIHINGKTYIGNNITINNGNVIIDGEVAQENLSGIVEVKVTGDLASLNSDSKVSVSGNVHGDVYARGSVDCGDIGKNLDAGGSVQCGNVDGYVDAGGSVNAENINGDVDAGGSIRYKK